MIRVSMTKGGVTLFTKSAALNLARKGYPIRVNSIHPGVIETDMGAQTFVARATQTRTNDTDRARQAALTGQPIGRLGVADELLELRRVGGVRGLPPRAGTRRIEDSNRTFRPPQPCRLVDGAIQELVVDVLAVPQK